MKHFPRDAHDHWILKNTANGADLESLSSLSVSKKKKKVYLSHLCNICVSTKPLVVDQ